MIKKLLSCFLSATIMLCASVSFASVSAEDTAEEMTASAENIIISADETEEASEYLYNNQMTIFDAIKIKRSLAANETTYEMTDYEYVRDNLLRKRRGDVLYSRKVVVEFDTEGYEPFGYSDLSVIDAFIANGGGKIDIPQHTLKRDGASHGGWQYEGKNYIQGEIFEVPDVDKVVFTPYWFIYHKVTFYAGDYDDVVEYPSVTLQGTEGVGMELADTTRFTRPGYNLVGWMCDLDGLDYGPLARYIIPDRDVVFTAMWEPAAIPLTISANNGVSTDKITDSVFAGDEFVFPECTFTNGDKAFVGWVYNKVLYEPGDSITIPALKSGLSVIITAYWS